MTRYLDDVRGQPATLRALVQRFGRERPFRTWGSRWSAAGRPPIVLTGMGASLFAAEVVVADAASRGIAVQALATSDLLETLLPSLGEPFVVVISQSGESIEVKDLLDRIPANRVLSLTNQTTSWLARNASESVVMELPGDGSVAIQTYVGTLAALHFLSAEWNLSTAATVADDLLGAAGAIERLLPRWSETMLAAERQTRGVRAFSVLGWGPGVGSAHAAALLLKEAARTPAEGMSAAAFRHGAVEVVDEHHGTIFFLGPPAPQSDTVRWDHVAEVAALGGPLIVVGGEPSGGQPAVAHVSTTSRGGAPGAIADIVPMQLFAMHRANGLGFEAGAFRNTTPVISERPTPRVAVGR